MDCSTEVIIQTLTNNVFKIISAVNAVAEASYETQLDNATEQTYFKLYNAYGLGAGKIARILYQYEWQLNSNHW